MNFKKVVITALSVVMIVGAGVSFAKKNKVQCDASVMQLIQVKKCAKIKDINECPKYRQHSYDEIFPCYWLPGMAQNGCITKDATGCFKNVK